MLLLLLCHLLISITPLIAIIEVKLNKESYNYAANLSINAIQFPVVVDTGSSALMLYNNSYHGSTANADVCLALSLDGTRLNFVSKNCTTNAEHVKLGAAQSVGIVSESTAIQAANPVLHNWGKESGDFGLSYSLNCTKSFCQPTTFQNLLMNSSDGSSNLTFGLDFRDPQSSIASVASESSSMQLGGVKASFASQLNWARQVENNLVYHQFFLNDMRFCGVKILGNYSTNWEVLVDSGSSCLTLPGEIYDSFSKWFANSTVVSTFGELPAFSFDTSASNETLFIPLANLLIDPSAIKSEEGAPYVSSPTTTKRVCVLRGPNIRTTNGKYNYPVPQIILGTLALQSIYFAADFRTGSVALANKLYPSEVAFYSTTQQSGSCAKPKNCIGNQLYHPFKNKCQDPKCRKYFFTQLDESRGVCVYSDTALGFGLFFIVFIVLLEVLAFFIFQYSSHVILESRRANTQTIHIDGATILIGKYISLMIDFLDLVYTSTKNAGTRIFTRVPVNNDVPQAAEV